MSKEMTSDALYAALRNAARTTCDDLLPDGLATFESRADDVVGSTRDAMCVLRIVGTYEGALALSGSLSDARVFVHRIIAHSLGSAAVGDDDGDEGLSKFEESALRELCNRISAEIVLMLSDHARLEVTFPVFLRGDQARIGWSHARCASCDLVVEDARLTVSVGLDPRSAERSSDCQRIRTIEQMRASVLAGDC